MLTITVKGKELFDYSTNKFFSVDDVVVELEHSLVSLSKWEAKHQKPFLSGEKTNEEFLSYIQFMIISPGVDPDIVFKFSQENFEQINEYINSKETATTFGMMVEKKGRAEVITEELIRYWMYAFQIPKEHEHDHLNKLFTLIRVCNVKQSKPKKMSPAEIAARQRELNARRRAETGSRG
jgi:hypothetical protein